MSVIYKHEDERDAGLAFAVKPGISIGRIALATIVAVVTALLSIGIGAPLTWAIVIGAAIGGFAIAILRAHHSTIRSF